jgi:O-antigen/teichoic acid export membrane protein
MKTNKKVVKAGIGYTISNYLINGLNFLTIPIFARMLSTSDYGIYNTFVAYQSVLFILIGLAIHSSYRNARFKYKYKSESKNKYNYETYVSSSMVMILLITLFLFVFINIFSSLAQSLLGLDILSINLLLVYSLGSAVICCFNTNASLNYQYQSFVKVSLFNAVSNILMSLLLIKFVFITRGYFGRMIGTSLSIFIVSVYIIVYFFRRAKPANIKEYLSWGLKYSLPIVPHGISQVILSQFDRIMIHRMISSMTAGIYSFAYNIFTIIQVTYSSLDTVWSQWFYEQMHKKNYGGIKSISSIYITAMFVFSCIMMLVCPEVILILGSAKYYDSIYCAIPIIAGGYFSFLYLIPSVVEYYYEKTKYIAIGTCSAAIINILLNYIFISIYGYVAAAYTTMFTYFLYFSFHYTFAWIIQGRCLFSTKLILLTIVAIVFMVGVSLYFVKYIMVRWGIAILLSLLFIVFEEKKYGFGLAFFKRK